MANVQGNLAPSPPFPSHGSSSSLLMSTNSSSANTSLDSKEGIISSGSAGVMDGSMLIDSNMLANGDGLLTSASQSHDASDTHLVQQAMITDLFNKTLGVHCLKFISKY
jgi:hypothetical protein